MPEEPARIERRAAAGHEGDRQSQGHGHVHADAALAQLRGRGLEERSRRQQHDRQRQHPLAPAQQGRLVRRHLAGRGHVGRPRQHHHLHHQEARHEQSPDGLPVLASAQFARGPGKVRGEVVAGGPQRLPQLLERDVRRRPVQQQGLGGGVHLRRMNPAARLQRGFDQPGAGGAMHAREPQARARDALAARCRVPLRDGAQRFVEPIGRRGRRRRQRRVAAGAIGGPDVDAPGAGIGRGGGGGQHGRDNPPILEVTSCSISNAPHRPPPCRPPC